MEFVISSRDAPTGSIYEDETYCTRGLCSHPSCWGSHIRQTRGFRKYVSMSADPSTSNRQPAQDDAESDDGLATQKVLNLLDEYGESPTDLYPSRFRGIPAHLRKQRGVKEGPRKSVVPPHVPRSSPYHHNKQWQYDEVLEPSRRSANVNHVEVQEVFDLEELSQTWDNTFLTKPMYVWIPGKKGGKSKRTRKQKLRSSSHKHLSEPETVAPKDFAADVLPQQPHTSPTHPRQNRSRSPTHLPTGGQPYHNVGQTPKDRLRYRMIMDELKDLPRPFVIEVMEKTRGMKNKEEILMLMERYLTTMKKSDWELSMVTGQVLRQRRLNKNMFEYYERMRYPAGEQVYKLDEESADEVEEQDEQRDLSAVPDDVIADAICKTKYKPLPDIVKKKNTVRVHVATTTEESVKPFHYKKQQNMEFCLGPTRSLSSVNFSRPQSQRTSLPSARDHTNLAADMSVLYDQESVDRHLNNNNADTSNKRDAVAGSRTSSVVVPKAPAGTPYTPTTPARERMPGENTTTGGAPITLPDGVVLEVIQETSAVDDFTAKASKDKQSQERQIHSVLEGRVSASLDNRRVASAKLSRDIDDKGMKRRVQSANNISLAVVDSSSVAGQPDNQVTDMQGGQTARATTSRLDVVSTTSNWPNIDEEALLREQTTPNPEQQPARVLSAPGNETESRNVSAKRPATQPVTKPHEKTKIVIDLPAPPPPSPEPSDKPRLSSFQDERQSDGTPKLDSQTPVNTAAVIDMSDLSDLPPANQSPQVASEANQSAALPIPLTNETTQLSHLTEQSTLSVEQGDSKEIKKDELSQKLELVMNVDTGRDALSLVPDYKDMDMEREITLSSLPPSALDTPDVTTPAHLRKPTNSEKGETTTLSTDKQSAPSSEQPLPTVAEVMRPDDEGGLAG